MIKEGNVRIAVTLSSNTNDAIRGCCKQIGCSVSDLIQELLTEFLIEFDDLSFKVKGDTDAGDN